MKPTKPIYSVKKLNGQTVVEGDFDTIQAWLAEGRISSDDDLRREGVHVYEGDELWGRVKDFPEFNLNDREGRRALYRAKVRANVWLLICGFILLLGVGLICYDQVIPRYTEAQRVEEALELARKSKADEALAIQRAEEAEAKANKKIQDNNKASDIKFNAQEEKNTEEKSQLNREIIALRESMGDDSKTRKDAQKEVASLKQKIPKLMDENAQLKLKILKFEKLMDENAQLKLEILKFEKDHSLYHPEKKR